MGGIFLVGSYLYMKMTKAKNHSGEITIWDLLIFFVIIYLLSAIGPVTPSVEPIAFVGLSQWLLVAWGYWINKNRIF